MKKSIFVAVLLIGLSLCVCSICLAESIPISLAFPEGTLSAKITKLISTDTDGDGVPNGNDWAGAETVTTMDFGELEELVATVDVPSLGIKAGDKLAVFCPADNRYFAVELAFSGGGYPADLSCQVMGTGTDISLIGKKIVTVYRNMKFMGLGELPEETPKFGKLLEDTVSLNDSDFKDGKWIRIYVGIAIPLASGDMPVSGAEPFSYGDAAKPYSVALQFSLTG